MALSAVWASRVRGGIPFIELGELVDLPADLAPGDAVVLTASDGGTIGFGILDPDNGVLRTLPAEPGETLDDPFFHRRIASAAALRRRLELVADQTAYRLVNAEGDGLSGFVVDVYAGHVVVYTFSPAFDRYVAALSAAIGAELSPKSIIHKVRPAGRTPTGKVAHTLLAGTEPPRQLVVDEAGVRYEVHLLAGLNTGLFAEMRQVRRALLTWAAGRHVLNLFCYTGSFSVVSARAGARSVTSVDYARGVVEWCKTNFKLNELAPESARFRFVRADAFDFLKTERRRGRRYDVVILDPPAATAVPGRRWYLESDYDRLIGHALAVVPEEGLLIVAASSVRSRPEKLENQIRAAARDHGRRLRLIQSFGLPPDCPTQMIYPQSRFLKCFFLLVE